MKTQFPRILRKKSFTLAAALVAVLMLSSHYATAQPTIANVFPNGSYQFQYTNSLSFTVTSSPGVASVSVTLVTTNLLTGAESFPLTLTGSSGLTVSGSANDETVSASLTSNTLYGVTIVATDVNSLSTTQSFAFDTISPAYTWEAIDWNYTSNGITGLYIDNPQTNAYAGLNSTPGADFYNPDYNLGNDGPEQYRPQGLETESCSDAPRLAYSPFTTNQDFDVGYNNGNNWGEYTRHYPPGVYNVFVRASDGNGPQNNAGDISVAGGTATFANSGPYYFSVKATGWQSFRWYPLIDSTGNPAVLTIPNDGTASTLMLTIDGGNCNEHFFMLLPLNTNVPPIGAGYISGAFPDGTYQFQDTNTFNCSVLSTNGIESIVAEVTGNYLTGGSFQQVLTSSSGLTITGTPDDENVSFPLSTNTMYSVTFLITDGAGNNSSTNFVFDTIYPNYYTWEAEDWDYEGGKFIDNPQTNAYDGLLASYEIDSVCAGGPSGDNAYGRGLKSDTTTAMSTEPSGDVPRAPYINTPYTDYAIGYTAGGQWGNYTRTYPAGIYNIYVRIADGGNAASDSGTFSLVTGGYGTASQTWSQMGSFNAPSSGGWNTYTWTPVLNAAGYPARFMGSNGIPQTLHVALVNANCNLNYYMLVPANLSENPPPFVDNFLPDGTAMFQPSNQMTFTANSSVGLSQNNVVVLLNGVQQTNLTFSGSPLAYNVICPLQTNQLYTAIITLTDASGTTAYTNTFATFSSADYQFEAEDYDYTTNGVSGQFFDNPQVNDYLGLGGTSNIDLVEVDGNAFARGYSYRKANGQDFPDTASGDLPRDQFTSVGATDYSIGSFGANSWANYTRHYPPGTYNVIGRFAEGASLSHAMMSILTSGYGTSPQTTNFLGTFIVPEGGWSSWEWSKLADKNGNLVKVTLDGNLHTLQLEGSPNNSDPEVNVNFFLLAPTTPLPNPTANISGATIKISFFAQTGYTYQVEYKTNLTDPSWTPLGSSVTGNNTDQTVSDTLSASHRFYIVQTQPTP